MERNYVLFFKMNILIVYFELGLKCYKILKISESSDIFQISPVLGDIIKNLRGGFPNYP